MFFHQDLMIDGSEVGDTAAYYPDNHTLYHYKRSLFMFNGFSDEGGMMQYTTGIKRFQSAEGTWRDAEDGSLMGTPSRKDLSTVRSASGQSYLQAARKRSIIGCRSEKIEEVKDLNQYVQESHPEKLLKPYCHLLEALASSRGEGPGRFIAGSVQDVQVELAHCSYTNR